MKVSGSMSMPTAWSSMTLLMLSQPLTQRSVWSMYGAGTIFFIKMPPSKYSALSKQSEMCYYVG